MYGNIENRLTSGYSASNQLQCIVYSVHCTVYSVHCRENCVQFTVYTALRHGMGHYATTPLYNSASFT